jgi:hypothetical protein
VSLQPLVGKSGEGVEARVAAPISCDMLFGFFIESFAVCAAGTRIRGGD